MIRAMVMAAGAGTRLRPLTHTVAKPMVPVGDRPVLEYTLLNLRRHGIRDIALNLHAFPEQIQTYFGDGSRWGVRLRYSHETELLGTAGGVKRMESFLSAGTFLVLSGDGLCDVDLTRLIEQHRTRKSLASMAIAQADSRLEYGVTLTGARNRIRRFVEKPAWGDVFSNQVNTGIYVFEPRVFSFIPNGQPFDFGKQVWPALLRRRQPIHAFPMSQFWCDIGNLAEYRRAQQALLDRRLWFRPQAPERRRGVWAARDVTLKGVIVEPPVLIGSGARVARGARLGPHTIVGASARVAAGARLERTTVGSAASIGTQISLRNCVVGDDVFLDGGPISLDGAVVTKNDTLTRSRINFRNRRKGT